MEKENMVPIDSGTPKLMFPSDCSGEDQYLKDEVYSSNPPTTSNRSTSHFFYLDPPAA